MTRQNTYELRQDQAVVQDHLLNGKAVLAAAIQLEFAALTLASESIQSQFIFDNIRFLRPGLFRDHQTMEIHVSISSSEFKIFANNEVLCGGKLTLEPITPLFLPFDSFQVSHNLNVDKIYQDWAENGISYGPQYRTITQIEVDHRSARATISRPNDGIPWRLNPLLLDGAIQVASSAIGSANIPVYIERLIVHPTFGGSTQAEVYIRLHSRKEDILEEQADIWITDSTGQTIVTIVGLKLIPLNVNVTAEVMPDPTASISIMKWNAMTTDEMQELITTPPSGEWIIATPRGNLLQLSEVAKQLGINSIIEFTIDDLMLPNGALPDQTAFEQRFRSLIETHAHISCIVYAPFSTNLSSSSEADSGVMGLVSIIKTLTSSNASESTRLIVLTEAAQKVVASDMTIFPDRTALWGALRTAAIEYPNHPIHIVDMASGANSTDIRMAMQVNQIAPNEIALRNNIFYKPIIVSKRLMSSKPLVKPLGRYLITGGLGGIGIELTKRLLSAGAGEILLITRNPQRHHDSLTMPGTRIISADLASRGDLAQALASAQIEPASINGVFHAAGLLKDSLIRNATYADIATVMASKAHGAMEIEKTFANVKLDYIVAFASVSGLFGNIGQVAYASANSFLDGLAMRPGSWISIDWGLWGQIGMGVDLVKKLERTGFKALQTNEAFTTMWAMLASDYRHATIANDILNKKLPDITDESEPVGLQQPNTIHQLMNNLEQKLLDFVRTHLGLSVLDPEESLSRHGMSSIISTEMAETLSNDFSSQLLPTLFLEHDTVRDVTRVLQKSLPNYQFHESIDGFNDESSTMIAVNPLISTDHSVQTKPRPSHNDTNRNIAIVALSTALPGATNLDDFWKLIEKGETAFSPVPNSRFNTDILLQAQDEARVSCTIGAFLDNLEPDVAALARVSKREYEEMDPQQKLMLFHASEVLSQVRSKGDTVGVYIAATYTHQRDRLGLSRVTPYGALGTMNAFLSNRISHAFNLTGPSQTIDTLCSSSLVALQHGVEALRSDQCTSALVGACNVGLTDWYYRSLSQLGVLTPHYPRPFDVASEGFVPGEGVVAILLKPLSQAQSDGDSILGVIKGIATGHNGGGGSLTVPIRESQTRVIKQAVSDANLTMLDIDYFETHGTATKLGDPIEIAALHDAVVTTTDKSKAKHWFIGATKGNIGHQEPVAGLASLVKVLQCFAHQTIPPIAGLKQLNPSLEQYKNHFVFPTYAQSWMCTSGVRRAGISAFGMGGTNAHVVVEEYKSTISFDEADHTADTLNMQSTTEVVHTTDIQSMMEAHRLHDKPIVPAALSLQHLFEFAPKLTDIQFLKPGIEITPLICQILPDSLCVKQGSVTLTTAIPATVNSPIENEIPAQVADDQIRHLDAKVLYAWFASLGLQFGKSLRVLTSIDFTPVWATADLDEAHALPALIDAIFQICGVLTLANSPASRELLIPYKIKHAYAASHGGRPSRVQVWRNSGSLNKSSSFSGQLLDSNGLPIYVLDHIEFTAWPYLPDDAKQKFISNNIPHQASFQSDFNHYSTSDQVDIDVILDTIRDIFRDPNIQPSTNLVASGMDSILANEIAQRLSQLGWQVNPITVLSANNALALTHDIRSKLPDAPSYSVSERQLDSDENPSQVDSTAEKIKKDNKHGHTPIGIIGMAYRLPYRKDDGGFWQTLKYGHTAFTESPDNRFSNKTQNHHKFIGAFLESVGNVDANLFELAPHVANAMDPQMRLLLEVVWEALEDTGINPLGSHKNIGIFVGASYNHYKNAFFNPSLDANSGLGNHNAFLANRVSYFFDFTGPSMTIDTLCSSSLVALHQAVQSLRNHECDQAIVAGVNIPVTDAHHTTMSNLAALSSTSELSAFDSSADGFIPGEGVVVLILQRSDEVNDHRVKAVVKSTAVNHGGRSAGLTVPSSDAQATVVSAALRDAGVSVDTIGLVEAHGTGTVLGDPIEIEGLKKAWSNSNGHRQVCGLGSIKSNIGHLEPAAGLAGVAKVILAMQENILPPTVGVSRPNDHIAFEDSPFFLIDRPTPWPANRPLAGVSAFGMGGVNAHVILAPASAEPPVQRLGSPPETFICKVSAATESALRRLAGLYAEALDGLSAWQAADFCFTANTARATLSYIVVVSASTVNELIKTLKTIANGMHAILTTKDATTPLPADMAIEDIVELARDGIKLPHAAWHQLSPTNTRITSIPTYPFEGRHHWIYTESMLETNSTLQTISWLKQPLIKNIPQSSTNEAFTLSIAALSRSVWLSSRVTAYWGDDLISSLSRYNLQLAISPEHAEILIDLYASGDNMEYLWHRMTSLPHKINPVAKMVLICQDLYPRKTYASFDQIRTAIAAGAAVAWRSLAAEMGASALIIDNTENTAIDQTLIRIIDELDAKNVSTVISWPENVRHVLTYQPKQAISHSGLTSATESTQYWVVIGGSGGLGLALSRFLSEYGYGVIAIGRSQEPSSQFQELMITQGPDRVIYRSADATNLQDFLAQCKPIGTQGTLVGIVNAAGQTSQVSSVAIKTWRQVDNQMTTKITTTINAIEAAKQLGGKYVVLTSSLAAVEAEAGKGLADYAAGNAAQAALAMLHSVNDPLIVIAHLWPNWSGIGLNAESKYAQLHSLSVDEAVSYFARHLTESGVLVIHGHPNESKSMESISSDEDQPSFLNNHEANLPSRKIDDIATMHHLIEQAVYAVLGPVDNFRSFTTMGLNSLLIADLVATIESKTGLVVAPSIFFEQQNVDQLIKVLIKDASDSTEIQTEIGNASLEPTTKAVELAKILSQRKEIYNERT